MKFGTVLPFLLTFLILSACESQPVAPQDAPCKAQLDSVAAFVELKVDSVQAIVDSLQAQIETNQQQILAIRDSAIQAKTQRPLPATQIFRNKEKGKGANQHFGKTPGKGSDPSYKENAAKTEEARLINQERMRIHDSIQKAKETTSNGGK